MSWVYLDDQFPEHPKVIEVGGDAAWLYVCGLAYVNRHLTAGRIPKAIVPRLSDRVRPDRLAGSLVKVGLWEDLGDHYLIHDYDAYNRSAEKERRRRSDRARHAAEARWGNARAMPEHDVGHVPKHGVGHDPPHVGEHVPEQSPGMPPAGARAPNPSPSLSLEHPPPLTSRKSLGPSANGAGLTAGEEEEDETDKSRSKDETTGLTDSAEQHLRRTCLVIAARRFVTRPPESEPIRRPELWQSQVAREAVERFRDAHRSMFSDAVSLGRWPTEQEMADVLEPPVGINAIDATAADDP